LIIVLGVMCALLTLAVFGHAAARARISLGLAARQTATDLQLARLRAIARNREQRIRFAPGEDRYRPQERGDTGFSDADAARLLPAGVRIRECTAPGDAITFRPQGGAGSFGSVTLGNDSGETRSITVSITGRTRIR
jgi:hypothetical protein